MGSDERPVVLAVEGLLKSYGANLVLKGLSFELHAGEIMAFLGPNGAGKSTAISCLSGATRADGGTIRVGGEPVTVGTPREAMAHGIAVIYQHLSLVESLSASDNVFLGAELRTRTGSVDRGAQEARTAELLADLGASFDTRTPVRELSTGEQQLVEIAKALRRQPRVLVLDEPTAALSDAESRNLLARLDALRRRNHVGILFVSHLLDEVFALADTVTVVRDGRISLSSRLADIDPDRVVREIAPDLDDAAVRRPAPVVGRREAPLVEMVAAMADGVGPVDLSVRAGESVALFGMLGSGRTELLELVCGVRPLVSGVVRGDDGRSSPRGVRARLRRGTSFVPADRKRRAMFGPLTAQENVLVPHHGALARARGLVRSRRAEREEYLSVARRMTVQPGHPHLRGAQFSGGNQQKLVLARWLCAPARTRLLVMDEPTQGIDVGARHEIYAAVDDLVSQGMGVLFATSDPDEAIRLADHIYVLHRGQIVARLDAAATDIPTLLRAAHSVETVSPTLRSTEP